LSSTNEPGGWGSTPCKKTKTHKMSIFQKRSSSEPPKSAGDRSPKEVGGGDRHKFKLKRRQRQGPKTKKKRNKAQKPPPNQKYGERGPTHGKLALNTPQLRNEGNIFQKKRTVDALSSATGPPILSRRAQRKNMSRRSGRRPQRRGKKTFRGPQKKEVPSGQRTPGPTAERGVRNSEKKGKSHNHCGRSLRRYPRTNTGSWWMARSGYKKSHLKKRIPAPGHGPTHIAVPPALHLWRGYRNLTTIVITPGKGLTVFH